MTCVSGRACSGTASAASAGSSCSSRIRRVTMTSVSQHRDRRHVVPFPTRLRRARWVNTSCSCSSIRSRMRSYSALATRMQRADRVGNSAMPTSAERYRTRQRSISNAHQLDEPGRASTLAERRRRIVSRSSLGRYCRPRSEVFVDVAKEVRELEREPEVACRAERSLDGQRGRGSAASARRSPPPSRPCTRGGRPTCRTR